MDFNQLITQRLQSMKIDEMTAEERAVMAALRPTFYTQEKKTQRDIVLSERWLGCHPKHEKDIVQNELETTTRQVRQIINDLRTKYHAPILSDESGYWICRSQEEAEQFITRMEQKVKSTTKAYYSTYGAMKEALNIQSSFFEALDLIKT